MKKTKLIIKAKSKSYPIYFGSGILSSTGRILKKSLPNVKKICIITDNKIPKIFLKKLVRTLIKYEIKIYKIPSNEKTKSLKVANKIIEKLLKYNFNKTDCVISFGGGILGDLSAFISNLTKRGLSYVNIPSTLLAQVDASIGGKTGINTNQGKNLIGTFYQPDFVLSDVSILKSLPQREIISGYGEILKHSLILDKKFFLWLYKNGKEIINSKNKSKLKKAIIKSCKIKNEIVRKDEKEKNLRMILNFGHTFAHGFEGAKKFSKSLNHGEAVMLGMLMASKLAYNKKLLPLKDLKQIENHYKELNLPMRIKKYFQKKDIKKIISFMKKDKKNINEKINLILIKKIGLVTKPNAFNISVAELEKFLIKNFK